eukprot:TRINITY_DN1328_c0_g1_i4.p1 TRINITY_DN1328_c0_g1~~TRINITY_DN1328_c0_g1_i4.p1  ORF type:complete len:135 (+),score=36.94 TRINITY_DN1328_c0_g1_i4:51-407(+)
MNGRPVLCTLLVAAAHVASSAPLFVSVTSETCTNGYNPTGIYAKEANALVTTYTQGDWTLYEEGNGVWRIDHTTFGYAFRWMNCAMGNATYDEYPVRLAPCCDQGGIELQQCGDFCPT